jgi:ribosomal protein S6E (S10)
VEGGLSGAKVRRPGGIPVAVEIDGGATDLRLDDIHLGAVGGAVRQRTPAQPDADGEVAVRVLGGASQLTVD